MILQFNYVCPPLLCSLINRCEVWPSRQKVAECNWAHVDSLVRPDQAGAASSVTGGDGDNSLIWRRWVNISNRAITWGEGGGRNTESLFEVVSRAESIPREKQRSPIYVLIPGAKSLVSRGRDSSSAGRSCSHLSEMWYIWWASSQRELPAKTWHNNTRKSTEPA